MSSKRECFVFIQLPNSLETVTCGRYERQILRNGAAVGRFVYGQSYRQRPDAVPLDPFHLPVAPTTYETAKLDGVFGAIRDSSPDAWGRRIIERVLGRTDLDEIDYLLESPQERVGALAFGRSVTPPAPIRDFNRVVQLVELREAARLVEADDTNRPLPESLRRLVDTSLGGARPKNVVEDEEGLWISKFPAKSDRWNNAVVEAAMLSLAVRCGIRAPDTRVEKLAKEDVLLLRRFDREKTQGGYFRHRMLSAITALDADDNAQVRSNWSYLLLADEVQRWSARPADDKAELFKRVAFNALISNTDDHPRNHAFVAAGTDWRLSPAYDLTPSPQLGVQQRDLAMICGRFGRSATRQNLLSEAPRFGLSREVANEIVDRIRDVIAKHWTYEVKRQGGSGQDCDKIAPAFVYDGFEYTRA